MESWQAEIRYSFNEYVSEKINMNFATNYIKFLDSEIEEYIEQFIEDMIRDKREYGDWEKIDYIEIPNVKKFLLALYCH